MRSVQTELTVTWLGMRSVQTVTWLGMCSVQTELTVTWLGMRSVQTELTVTMTFLQPDRLAVIHIPLKARHSARSHATYTGGS